jgi:hypothetical protein
MNHFYMTFPHPVVVVLCTVLLVLFAWVYYSNNKLKQKKGTEKIIAPPPFEPTATGLFKAPFPKSSLPIHHPVEFRPTSSSDGYKHLLNLVDLLDEVVLLKKTSPTDVPSLAIIEARITDLIVLSDGEIIRDTVWNPERQRAVKVVNGEGLGITIISSRSSGLTIKGRVVKKEEVIIAKAVTS